MLNNLYVIGGLILLLQHDSLDASPVRLHIQPGDCKITFKLGAVAHSVAGEIPLQGGTVMLDLEQKQLQGDLLIHAKTITTHHQGRDHKMQQQVLESQQYPEIHFRPQRFIGDFSTDKPMPLTIMGEVELQDQLHDISIPGEISVQGEELTWQGAVAIPYVAWGLHDPSVFILRVAKQIHLHVILKLKWPYPQIK